MLYSNAILAAGVFFTARYFQFEHFSSAMLAFNGVFVSLFASALFRYRQRVGVGLAGERTVQRILSELGVEALHDIYLPTPKGSMQIDHIALFPASLAVFETKTYNGHFALDGKSHWYRIIRRGWRYRINNPLWQLEAAKKAVAQALPNVRVGGAVVLAGHYTTSNGHPNHVLSADGLRNHIEEYRQRHSEWRHTEQINEAWTQLKALKCQYAPLGKTHVMNARKKRGDRFYSFEETWSLWLWGSLAAEAAILCLLAEYQVI